MPSGKQLGHALQGVMEISFSVSSLSIAPPFPPPLSPFPLPFSFSIPYLFICLPNISLCIALSLIALVQHVIILFLANS